MFVSNSKPIYEEMELFNIEGFENQREGVWLDKFPGLIRPTYYNWEYIN